MRLFIAINFPELIRKQIEKSRQPLMDRFPQLSWTKLENIHLTLKFLGNVGESQLADLKRAIRQSVEGIKPFELNFKPWGCFDRYQLIVWLGVKSSRELSKLEFRLEEETARLGFFQKRRTFFHVTVGRGKHLSRKVIENIKQVIQNERETSAGMTPIVVSEICLMQSTLTRGGAFYTSLKQFALR